MRWLGLIGAMLALVGCSGLRDAFSAHPQVAGSAGGQTLSVERLANLVGHAQRIPVRPDVMTGVANVYLDYAVFAADLGRSRDLHDSALVLAAQWPMVAQLKWERYHDRLAAARGKLTPAQADSAFAEGTVRLFQHILFRVPASAVPMVEQQKHKDAERVLLQAAAQRGTNFARLVARYSEDPGSKARGGYLPATPRGQFVPAFDSAAWTLPPGGITAVVRTPFGFHIIRRPPLAEVRDSFLVELERSRSGRLDSLYLDSLARDRQLEVESGAAARVREAVPQIVSAREDDRAQFVKLLAQRDMLLQQAEAAGVGLTPDDWRQVRAEHDSSVARLERLLGLTPEILRDSAATPAARVQLAMTHVDGYVDRAVTQGTAPFYPVPPFLASVLRQGEPWSLNQAGIARALEAAQAIRARDTTGRSPAPTGLKPAPGPPPVPPR